jgi:hypothetical protein
MSMLQVRGGAEGERERERAYPVALAHTLASPPAPSLLFPFAC